MPSSLYLKDPARPRASWRRPRRGGGAVRRRRCRCCRRPRSRQAARSSSSASTRAFRTLLAALPAGAAAPDRRGRIPGAARADDAAREPGRVRGRARAHAALRAAPPTAASGWSTCSGSPTPATWPSACARSEAKNPAVRKLKYSLHPLLSSFYRRLDQAARRELEQRRARPAGVHDRRAREPEPRRRAPRRRLRVHRASIADFDFNQFLAANKRYRLSADVFFEIYSDPGPRDRAAPPRGRPRPAGARVAATCRGCRKEQLQTQPGVVKVMMNAHVMTYLFADAWSTAAKLMASAKIKAEAERRRPAEILDAFLRPAWRASSASRSSPTSATASRCCSAVRRGGHGASARAAAGCTSSASRPRSLNNAVNATVLFLDLRGFTKTSEGQISERDLTRGAVHRLRRLRAPRAPLRRHRRQVPGRRDHDHLRHAARPTRSTR